MSTVARFQHVANGTSTTNSIAAAGIPGGRSIWADVLYEGPVPAGLGDAELLDVRARFLAADPDRAGDVADDLRGWRHAIAAHDNYDELVLWFEHDLFDQLNLLQLLPRIRRQVPRDTPVSLICIGSFPGRPAFKGLGELTPAELATLLDTRKPIDEAQYDLAERGWQAFREPSPHAVEQLLATDTSALPFLARALRRFLEEYPWTTDGLTRSERRLLQLIESQPMPLRAIFPRMQDGEEAYYVTDGTLVRLASELSRGDVPLLETSPVVHEGDPAALQAVARITDAGREVLGGRADRIALMGIDRWMGGVHLRRDNLWRWDRNSSRFSAVGREP